MALTYPPVGVAVVGCGSVSRHYLRMLRHFEVLRVLRCADQDPERAAQRVKQFGPGIASTRADVLADPAVEVIVDLTPPAQHAIVTRQALTAGKSVYVEKPITATAAQAVSYWTLPTGPACLSPLLPPRCWAAGRRSSSDRLAAGRQ